MPQPLKVKPWKIRRLYSRQDWARAHSVHEIYTANPVPAAEFAVDWPRCRTPEERMIAIDRLIHGVHARGALAPYFIDGHGADVVGMLNELAAA